MTLSADLIATLCLAAFVAGAVNSVAGGGTLLTFPSLLTAFASLGQAEAAVLANATSTVALVPGSAAGAWGYRRHLRQTRRWLFLLIGPTIIGGAIGALLVTELDPAIFAGLVPWLLLTAASLFLFDTLLPRKNKDRDIPRGPDTEQQDPPGSSTAAVAALVVFQLLVAIYGGYFGAGIGILLLSSLAMMGVGNIHQMNALKTTLALANNGIATIIFIVEGKVVWPIALTMALAASLGGYLGARLALRIQPRYVRWAVIFIAFGLAGYYFFKKYSQ